MTQPASPTAETMLGPYRLHHELGEGTFARVYLASAPGDGRLVVLKVAHRYDPMVEAGFRQEFLFASRLRHPHLGETLDHGVTSVGRPYLVLAYHPGAALAQRGGPLPEAEAARLGAQLARGLAVIHAEGLVHRDVTPQNVLLDEGGHARLVDFGMLAPAPSPTRGEGTPLYMAPEVMRGETADGRADLYALGAILYQLACGQAPFAELPADRLLSAVLDEAPEPVAARAPHLSPAFAGLVMRLLAKEPGDRPESAHEVAARLTRLAGEGAAFAVGAGGFFPPPAWTAWAEEAPAAGVSAFIGEPGLGRSRCLREAFAHLRRQGEPAVLLGGEEGEGPYGLLERLWRWAAAHAPEAVAGIPTPLAALIASLWPWAFPEVRPTDDPARLARVLPQVLALLLRRAAGGGSLTVLIDDWDHADAASRGVLAGGWATVLRECRWLIASSEPVKGAETRALTGFDARRAAAWVASLVETPEAGALAARLYDASHGNPGWMAQAVAHLAEAGALGKGDGGALAIPATVEAMLEATWGRLNPDQRLLAEALAVYGAPFAQADLEPLTGQLPTTWPLELGGLVARGVLALAGGRFRFAHGWWAAWIREHLASARRAKLSSELARALEAEHGLGGPEPDGEAAVLHRIAMLHAEGESAEARVKWALAAGRAAARIWANDLALQHFGVGLAAIAAHAEPWRFRTQAHALRVAQADVRRVVGDLVPAAEAYEAALADAPTTLARARILISLGKTRQVLNRLVEAREALEEAIALLAPLGDDPAAVRERLRGLSTLGRVLFFGGDRKASVAAYDEALALAREHALPGFAAEALSFLGTLLAGTAETADLGLGHLGEALGLREAEADPLGRLDTHMLIGNAFMGLGRYKEAREHFEANRAIAAEVGYRQDEGLALLNLALCDAEQGRWQGALARLDQAAELATATGYGFLLGFVRYVESVARLHLGDAPGMEAALDEAREREAALGGGDLRQYGLAYEAERHLFLGAFESARRAAELAVAAIEKAGGGELMLKARLLLAEAHVMGGELADGERELAAAEALIAASGAAAPQAQAGRVAGWLAFRADRLDEARTRWVDALGLARAEELDGLEAELLLALHLIDRRAGQPMAPGHPVAPTQPAAFGQPAALGEPVAAGEPGSADLARAYAIAERLRTPAPLALACLGLALGHLAHGDDLLAERLSRRGHDLLARFTESFPSAGARANFVAHPGRAPYCEAREIEEAHRLVQRGRRLEMLLELTRALGASRHPEGVLERVRAFTREVTQAERVLILLAAQGGELRPWGAAGSEEPYSKSIVARVVASREAECVLDTRESDALRVQASIVDLQVRSVMCVPLVVEQALHGVLYVDSRVALGAFGGEDLRVLEAIAAQAAVALDSARLFQGMRLQTDQLKSQLRLLEEKDTKIAALRDYDAARTAAFEAESHDLRAPLAAISASCQGLLKGLEGALSEPQAEMVDGVLLNARMLTRKIDGILDAAGAQAGKLTLRLQDLDLGRIADEIVRGLQPSAEAKGLVVRVDREAFARVPRVRADERRVGQMVQNLVDNAIKYTDRGEVTVTALVAGGVRLVVADTGPGLPSERLAAPFERYGARTVKVPGSGVGLWRVKALMEQHGGDVLIESEPGRGTRIALAFPVWPETPGD